MSFILDALKKSESERQSQGSAEFSGVPSSVHAPRVSRWVWIVGLLLMINLAVVFGLLLRPETTPVVASSPQNDSALALQAEQPSFSDQVSEARQSPPPMRASPGQRVEETAPAPRPVVTPRNRAFVPNIHEVRANGTIVLPELRLDMHVYSDVPEDRFVFINMVKQREGARLSEGPVVAEITPEGVVLNYQGTLFLLPRD